MVPLEGTDRRIASGENDFGDTSFVSFRNGALDFTGPRYRYLSRIHTNLLLYRGETQQGLDGFTGSATNSFIIWLFYDCPIKIS